MPHSFKAKYWVSAGIDELWNFHCDAKNLEKLTPRFLQAKVDGKMAAGQEVRIEMNPSFLPLKQEWISGFENIVDSGEKREFTDFQKKGPFRSWKHRHVFESVPKEWKVNEKTVSMRQPGCWVTDEVEYEAPAAILGAVAQKLILKKIIARSFLYRRKRFAEIFSHGQER